MKRIFLLYLFTASVLLSQQAPGQTKARGSDMPVKKNGMSLKAYKALIKSDKMVLVDFYADWCGPCKKMHPYLEEIKQEMGDQLLLIHINADENTAICNELSVYSLPTLFFYKKKSMYWFNAGYVEKSEILKHIR